MAGDQLTSPLAMSHSQLATGCGAMEADSF